MLVIFIFVSFFSVLFLLSFSLIFCFHYLLRDAVFYRLSTPPYL